MNLQDLAKATISEISNEIAKQEQELKLLKEEEKNKELEKIKEQERIIAENLAKINEISSKENLIKNEEVKSEISNENLTNESQEESENLIDEAILQEESSNEELANNENLNEDLALNYEIFLKNLRERILVLFEGLNATPKENLELRLNLTINFLEFLLASSEDKLKK